MLNKYQNKRIYGGKNYTNSLIILSHHEKQELEKIRKRLKLETIDLAIEHIVKEKIKEAKT